MNILFVCSRNKWRSHIAGTIFKAYQEHEVRSAGTSTDTRIKVNEKLVNWVDLIFVMEKRHRQLLEQKFSQSLERKNVIVLDIEDNYQYMDHELVDVLKSSYKSVFIVDSCLDPINLAE